MAGLAFTDPGLFYGDNAGNLLYGGTAAPAAAFPSGGDAALATALEGGVPDAATGTARMPPALLQTRVSDVRWRH
jgi:hypothetical protein